MFNNYPYNNIYQPNTNNLIFVNGIEGAKSYQIQPSQIVMLLDSDNPIVYKKTSNSFGQATIESYKGYIQQIFLSHNLLNCKC